VSQLWASIWGVSAGAGSGEAVEEESRRRGDDLNSESRLVGVGRIGMRAGAMVHAPKAAQHVAFVAGTEVGGRFQRVDGLSAAALTGLVDEACVAGGLKFRRGTVSSA
jgi:hypothetical protein